MATGLVLDEMIWPCCDCKRQLPTKDIGYCYHCKRDRCFECKANGHDERCGNKEQG